jgi:hypothetical protein
MRTLLLMSAAAGILLTLASPSQAIDGAWCLRGERGGGTVVNECQYASFEHCRRDIHLWGNTSACIPNWIEPQSAVQAPRRKSKSR